MDNAKLKNLLKEIEVEALAKRPPADATYTPEVKELLDDIKETLTKLLNNIKNV